MKNETTDDLGSKMKECKIRLLYIFMLEVNMHVNFTTAHKSFFFMQKSKGYPHEFPYESQIF